MNRGVVFLLAVGLFYLTTWFSGGAVGVSSAWDDSDCLVSASSSIGSVGMGLLLGAFVLFYPQRNASVDITKAVGAWRRFGAFTLDFMTVLLVTAPLLAMPILLAEAKYTGEFQWSFERDFGRATDMLYVLPSVVLLFVLLFLYFYVFSRRNRQTIGQYVLGYRLTGVLESNGEPQYARRTLLGFLGLCVWPVSAILALRKPGRVFWWDSASNTRAVRLSAVNNSVESDQPAAGP